MKSTVAQHRQPAVLMDGPAAHLVCLVSYCMDDWLSLNSADFAECLWCPEACRHPSSLCFMAVSKKGGKQKMGCLPLVPAVWLHVEGTIIDRGELCVLIQAESVYDI